MLMKPNSEHQACALLVAGQRTSGVDCWKLTGQGNVKRSGETRDLLTTRKAHAEMNIGR